ncbi:EcsC family protein [Tissierella sp. Yu-01]|uniref:EcsC family protein n=1 Tax=Tissierella sp. Yu-01 TaxID=3035694 RepID=UPI00240DD25A|nr:EcsC family protein [Tissierella sp. Yu-01]WFA09471.1 EcsC family protein [Tissierella sp. Yu-01]
MNYEDRARFELNVWKDEMRKKPNILEKVSKDVQYKINGILPDKYHDILTSTIKNFTKIVLFGSKYITKSPLYSLTLEEREQMLEEKSNYYKTAATIEGAATGAGGIMLGLADLPILLSIKIKFLYDIASIYGYDVNDYFERLYVLHIFELAFSSKKHTNKVFLRLENWDDYVKTLPRDINAFDWRAFQQEYRDYLDIAKLLQLVPGIGTFVGSYVNNKLLKKLSMTAKNAYRMRYFKSTI